MSVLFDQARHESLCTTAWDAASAANAIERIATAAIAAHATGGLWPPHPHVQEDGPQPPLHLYGGAAGTMWALHYLAEQGVAPACPDFSADLGGMAAANRATMDEYIEMGCGTAGLLLGESGILLTQARFHGAASVADRLAQVVDANQDNPVLELMWGSPGAMLAALAMRKAGLDAGDKARWEEKFRRDAKKLWHSMVLEQTSGCHLWRQNLYGHAVTHLGAVHGFASNVFPLIQGWDLLDADEQTRWNERIVHTLQKTAQWEDGLPNWPQSVGTPRPGRTAMLVQHCHGAPGMVTCLAGLNDACLDDILLAAAELTWRAGPLAKGANLCHGTAGNGYAFLKLFQRTGDEMWLARARRFAMHAMAQAERLAGEAGQYDFGLWTGDAGMAVYLLDCLRGRAEFPTMDVF